jgi:CCR4-NOT transcription complex subunit 4
VPPTRSPSPLLSSSDFPALTAQPPQPPNALSEPPAETCEDAGSTQPDEKTARRAEKKAAAAERAAERAKRRAEKERERAEKRVEKERQERQRKEKEKEKLEKEREERLERERTAKAQREREKARELEEAAAKADAQKKVPASSKVQKGDVAGSSTSKRKSNTKSTPASKATSTSVPIPATSLSPPSQGPLLSKLPKKNRPVTKPIRIPKEDELPAEAPSVLTSAANSEPPQLPHEKSSTSSVLDANSTSSRGQSMERTASDPTSVGELLAQIERQYPIMDLAHHPFFDAQKLNPTSKMTLEYGPLAHALSALSVGGGSFANNIPSGSVDNAVSSFQQLLETLTQTISDLLRLLPRTTWDDSSSFDGVLRDMLKGDDFFDDGSEDKSHTTAGKDEVAALTLALERRARWMEVQLSKLEELHRDINRAAVRAVLAFNDSGWDPHGFAPRTGGTLQKFDTLGMVNVEDGEPRPMTADELEKKLAVAKEAAVFAETEVREIMGRIQAAGFLIDGEY